MTTRTAESNEPIPLIEQYAFELRDDEALPWAAREVTSEYYHAKIEQLEIENEMREETATTAELKRLLTAVRGRGDIEGQLAALATTGSNTLAQCEHELARRIAESNATTRELSIKRLEAVRRQQSATDAWNALASRYRAPVVRLSSLPHRFRCIRARSRSSRRTRTVARIARKTATGDPDGDPEPPGDCARLRAIAEAAAAKIGGVA